MNNLVCVHCGGTNFYKDAGFFYCSECQIQSQEIQEQVFQEEDSFAAKRATKLIKEKPTKTTDNNRLTSWECYNYILYGLTDELIQLGADGNLKRVVRLLWLRYLEKLQVFRRNRDDLPKLQALSSDGDASIIYGKRLKRKRKSSTKSSSDEYDLSSLTSTSIKRLQAQKKREFIKAQYDRFTENTPETPSLHNETLLSLQTSSDKTNKTKSSISYNIYATRELYRYQSKYHLRKHRNDFERDLDCHRLKYKKLSNHYVTSPYLLSINKLYCILYLGLLIVGDRLRLSDLLRFVDEGRLSFKRYSQFFPEDIERKYCNFQDKNKNSVFNNTNIRKRTADLAQFLKVTNYVNQPDFQELTQRYCNELNLPLTISHFVSIIIKITDMRMVYDQHHKIIPNYEARILSIILVVMKLLYGFDGVTEFKLNELIETINHQNVLKQFDLIEWLNHLQNRSLIVQQSSLNRNLDLYLDMLTRRKVANIKLHHKSQQFHDILTQLNQRIPNFKVEDKVQDSKIFQDNRDFTGDSLEFLLKPTVYLWKYFGTIQWCHGGGQQDLIVEKLVCLHQELMKSVRDRRKFVTVTPVMGVPPERPEFEDSRNNSVEFLKNYDESNRKCYKKTRKRFGGNLDNVIGDGCEFYTPFERYWYRGRLSLDRLHGKQAKQFIKQLPYTFQIVFRECQRISQQNEVEFLREFLWTETHLVFNFQYGKNTIDRSVFDNKHLKNFLKNTVKHW